MHRECYPHPVNEKSGGQNMAVESSPVIGNIHRLFRQNSKKSSEELAFAGKIGKEILFYHQPPLFESAESGQKDDISCPGTQSGGFQIEEKNIA